MKRNTRDYNPSRRRYPDVSLPHRRNRKRRNWGRTVRGLLLLVVVIGVACRLCLDKRFNIRTVRVEGAATVPAAEIQSLARVRRGSNVFLYTLFNHKKVAGRIEAGEPAIESAHIRPRLPNILVLRVRERRPYAQLRINGGGPLLLLDETGVPYRRVVKRQAAIPAIIVPGSTPVPPLGKRLSLKPDNPIGAAYQVLGILHHGTDFQPLNLRDIRVDRSLYMCLNMTGRPMIKLGIPTDLPQKIATAAKVINGDPVRAQGEMYIDVTLPAKPAVRMKDTYASTKPSAAPI